MSRSLVDTMWKVDLAGEAFAVLLVSIGAHLAAVVSFVLRLRRRQIQTSTPRQDLSIFYRKRSDLYMLVAFVISIGNAICVWVEISRGSGTRYSLTYYDKDLGLDTERLLLTDYVSELFYTLTNGATKLSIAFFLLELTPELTPELHFARVGLHIMVRLIAGWTTVFAVISLFQCIPPDSAWKDGRQGNCVDRIIFRISQRTISIFVDVVLLAYLAQRMWSIPTHNPFRVVWLSTIGVGSLVCVCAVYWAAMYTTWMDDLEKADRYQHLLWPTVELYLRIAWANLPFLSAIYVADTPAAYLD